jgi:hypothetical protein
VWNYKQPLPAFCMVAQTSTLSQERQSDASPLQTAPSIPQLPSNTSPPWRPLLQHYTPCCLVCPLPVMDATMEHFLAVDTGSSFSRSAAASGLLRSALAVSDLTRTHTHSRTSGKRLRHRMAYRCTGVGNGLDRVELPRRSSPPILGPTI